MTDDQAASMTAWASVVTTAILAIGAFFAGRQVKEARRLRDARFRPFVVVDFDIATHPPFIYLVISNLGSVMARDIAFGFDPELSSSLDERPIEGAPPRLADLELFRRGLPTLPPGKRISVLFDSWIQRGDRPDAYSVKVTYGGEGSRRYEEKIRLDLAPFRYLRRIERRDLDDIHRELERIRRELRRWSAPTGGLKVKTPQDIRREQADWERELGATAEDVERPGSGTREEGS